MEQEKNKNGVIALLLAIIVILLALVVLFATGTISLKTEQINNNTNDNNQTINTVHYQKNDLVKVDVSDNITEDFFVISEEGDNLILISKNILFSTRFYDYDGSDCVSPNQYNGGDSSGCIDEYEKSSLKAKLLEHTKDWNNVIDVRILTIKEVEENVVTDHECGENCFRSKEFEKFLSLGNSAVGEYWLDNEGTESDKGFANYAHVWKEESTGTYYINVGQYFVNAPYEKGCRPVITVSKNYVKKI